MVEQPLVMLRKFFSHKSVRGEVQMAEYLSFFKSLSNDEKDLMKSQITLWDGESMFIPVEQQHAVAA